MHIMDGKKGAKMRITRRRGDRGEDGKEDRGEKNKYDENRRYSITLSHLSQSSV